MKRGGCLCGAVRYEARGPLRSIGYCHCSVCRRIHGEAAAYSACASEDLVMVEERGLASYTHLGATYTFCRECGSQVLWRRPGRSTIAIAAGSLDEPTGLAVTHRIWVESKADWETIADGLSTYPQGSPASG